MKEMEERKERNCQGGMKKKKKGIKLGGRGGWRGRKARTVTLAVEVYQDFFF